MSIVRKPSQESMDEAWDFVKEHGLVGKKVLASLARLLDQVKIPKRIEDSVLRQYFLNQATKTVEPKKKWWHL